MATILVADGDLSCRRPFVSLLKHENYNVVEACNGLEALQLLSKIPTDLVISDINMPGVDGVALLQAIRKNPEHTKIPVIMVASHYDKKRQSMAESIGMDEYVFKGDTPFAKMIGLIKRHLGEVHTPKRRGRKPRLRPEVIESSKPAPLDKATQRYRQLVLQYLPEKNDPE